MIPFNTEFRQYFSLFSDNKFKNPFAGFFLVGCSNDNIFSYEQSLEFLSSNSNNYFQGNIFWMEHELSDNFIIFLQNHLRNNVHVFKNDTINFFLYMATDNGVAFFIQGKEMKIAFNEILERFKEQHSEIFLDKEIHIYLDVYEHNFESNPRLKEELI